MSTELNAWFIETFNLKATNYLSESVKLPYQKILEKVSAVELSTKVTAQVSQEVYANTPEEDQSSDDFSYKFYMELISVNNAVVISAIHEILTKETNHD